MKLDENPFFLDEESIYWVNQTLNSMTLNEKIGQLFFPIAIDHEQDYLENLVQDFKPAGLFFRAADRKDLLEAVSVAQLSANIPLLIAGNLENGAAGIVNGGTDFGSQMQVAATDNLDNAIALGKVSSNEGRTVGCNITFSPVVDIDYNPFNPITNVRTYGSDPDKVASFSSTYVKTVQENGVAASIKHFPGDGIDFRDQHFVMSENNITPEQWNDSYGKVYKACINAGALTVMAGHISLPKYSKHINPKLSDGEILPASLSRELLTCLLRKKLGFNGLIITDASDMVGFSTVMKRELAIPHSIESGCDIILFNRNMQEDFTYMREGIENGIVSKERIDEAVTRVLATKAALKLHENSEKPVEDQSIIGCDEHINLASSCADEAITLVKNTKNIIPLSQDNYNKVLLISLSHEQKETSDNYLSIKLLKELLEKRGMEVTLFDQGQYVKGNIKHSPIEFKTNYDVVIYSANIKVQSNKTSLRINWSLPSGSDMPWFVNEVPTIFISFANPYHLIDVPHITSFINAYGSNKHSVEAVVKKLFGDSKFSGTNPVDPFVGRSKTYYR